MSQVAKDTAKDLSSVPATKNHKIRITLTSRNVKNLEKVCGDLVNRSKDKDLRVKGPVRLPTKRLHIVTRKTVRPAFILGGPASLARLAPALDRDLHADS